jgi:glycosyltransferase involved in cell wall biosynthesis
MRLVLIGDGESPHLLKWARALQARVELWAVSSRGFAPEFEDLVPVARRYVMDGDPVRGGRPLALLAQLPGLGRWLARADADWLNPHYLTSHGTLAWMAKRAWRLRARIAGSAWGSDILVTPERGRAYHWLTTRVLRACAICTSDSHHMSERMRVLGAREVMTFPFGLESLPALDERKQPWLFFANRALEPIYRPERVIEAFAAVAADRPEARLVVANNGSMRAALEARVRSLGLGERVEFVGRLEARTQSGHYARSPWYFSLPESDSVSVSVLEAMAHECVPILSDLPANHELVGRDGGFGLILRDSSALPGMLLDVDASNAGRINREWVAAHGLFAPAVDRFLARLRIVGGAV